MANALTMPLHRRPWPGATVRARLVWETAGEQWIDTTATAWTSTAVLVDVVDTRWQLNAAWLPADDVLRQEDR